MKPATYTDLFDLPEHMVGEIIAGEIYATPRPTGPHIGAASILGMDLGTPFQRGRGGPGGWWILDEQELHMGGDILVPDLAGWRREKMPRIPEAAYIELAPDWVCEILSPATYLLDRVRKLPIYAREGVKHVWLIEPIARTLEVFRLEQRRWVVVGAHETDELVRAEPFDAVELDLLALWGEERETPPTDGSEET